MRLFAALPLPGPAVERLTSLRLRLGTSKDGLRWSTPEQWHITVQFFGEVEDAGKDRLSAALAELELPPTQITIDEFGLLRAKGILFARVEATEALLALQAQVAAAAVACGSAAAAARPYRPHITLARSKGKSGNAALARLWKPSPPAFRPPLRWPADELLLLRSDLLPGGAEYTVLDRFPVPSTPSGEGGQPRDPGAASAVGLPGPQSL